MLKTRMPIMMTAYARTMMMSGKTRYTTTARAEPRVIMGSIIVSIEKSRRMPCVFLSG